MKKQCTTVTAQTTFSGNCWFPRYLGNGFKLNWKELSSVRNICLGILGVRAYMFPFGSHQDRQTEPNCAKTFVKWTSLFNHSFGTKEQISFSINSTSHLSMCSCPSIPTQWLKACHCINLLNGFAHWSSNKLNVLYNAENNHKLSAFNQSTAVLMNMMTQARASDAN